MKPNQKAVKEVVRAASSLGVAGLAVPIYMGCDSGSDSASRVLRAIRSELQVKKRPRLTSMVLAVLNR